MIRRMAFEYLDIKPSKASWNIPILYGPIVHGTRSRVGFLPGGGGGGPAVCRASVLCRGSETAGLTFVSHPSSDYLLVMSVPAHQQPDGLTLAALRRESPETLRYSAVRGPICLLQLPRHLPVWVLETSAQPQSRALERIFPVLCLWRKARSRCHLLLVSRTQSPEYLLN